MKDLTGFNKIYSMQFVTDLKIVGGVWLRIWTSQKIPWLNGYRSNRDVTMGTSMEEEYYICFKYNS